MQSPVADARIESIHAHVDQQPGQGSARLQVGGLVEAVVADRARGADVRSDLLHQGARLAAAHLLVRAPVLHDARQHAARFCLPTGSFQLNCTCQGH